MLAVVGFEMKALEEAVGKEGAHLKAVDRIREVRLVLSLVYFLLSKHHRETCLGNLLNSSEPVVYNRRRTWKLLFHAERCEACFSYCAKAAPFLRTHRLNRR